jgi:hypothetical protein
MERIRIVRRVRYPFGDGGIHLRKSEGCQTILRMTFVLCALCVAAHEEAEWMLLWVVTLQAKTPLFHRGLQIHHQLRTTDRIRR